MDFFEMNRTMLDSVHCYSHSKHFRRAQSVRKIKQRKLRQNRVHSKRNSTARRRLRTFRANQHRDRKLVRQYQWTFDHFGGDLDIEDGGYDSPSDLEFYVTNGSRRPTPDLPRTTKPVYV